LNFNAEKFEGYLPSTVEEPVASVPKTSIPQEVIDELVMDLSQLNLSVDTGKHFCSDCSNVDFSQLLQ
jgi:hypothetical protein